MNLEAAKKLKELYDAGYGVKISSYYVDGMATIWEHETDGLVYSSEVYSGRPLSEVSIYGVTVYEEVGDWMSLDVEARAKQLSLINNTKR